jgi:hypothetical protein
MKVENGNACVCNGKKSSSHGGALDERKMKNYSEIMMVK